MIGFFCRFVNVLSTITLCISLGIEAINVATVMPRKLEDILKLKNVTEMKNALRDTRRIIAGTEVHLERPYMVYLKLPSSNPKYKDYRRWLCGGVIVHEEYILTSAACIEDARNFYVVSGTYKHDEEDDRFTNLCIKNGAKRAIWKCIPRNYAFDGHENDNLRWMNNDIAVVKVEDEFDFTRRIRGCDFVPRPICYNNQSSRLEDPGTLGSIAGWGTVEKYNEQHTEHYKQDLLETPVRIITKNRCKKRWGRRYHSIIDNYMICTKDIIPDMSEVCQEKYVDCTDIMSSLESGEDGRRAHDEGETIVHSAYHNDTKRRQFLSTGGFCENDHGGPLVYGTGTNAIVIGIISACLVKERSNKCYGPFLYTSIYKNRNLINCAIYKDKATDCNKLFRSSITHTEVEMSWVDHPDGPAKHEIAIAKARRTQELQNKNQTSAGNETKDEANIGQDKVELHEGIIIRDFNVTSQAPNNNKTLT